MLFIKKIKRYYFDYVLIINKEIQNINCFYNGKPLNFEFDFEYTKINYDCMRRFEINKYIITNFEKDNIKKLLNYDMEIFILNKNNKIVKYKGEDFIEGIIFIRDSYRKINLYLLVKNFINKNSIIKMFYNHIYYINYEFK